jgi:hypothetical protein
MPRVVVEGREQIEEMAEMVRQSAIASATRLADLARANPGLSLLHALRFERHGRHPLGDRTGASPGMKMTTRHHAL